MRRTTNARAGKSNYHREGTLVVITGLLVGLSPQVYAENNSQKAETEQPSPEASRKGGVDGALAFEGLIAQSSVGPTQSVLSTVVTSTGGTPSIPGAGQQPTPRPAPRPALRVASTGALGDDKPENIVVTGSRIASPSALAPAPVFTLDSEDQLFLGKTDAIDVVTQVPALNNSINSAQTADQQGIEGDGDAGSNVGVATLNLRSLGTKRTLVLVDGRRHVGGRAGDTAVDINMIPFSLIDRVEVLTGGASAVYGADAVSGVVNFIMKKDFEGVQGVAQFDINDGGHGGRYYGSVSAGQNFDGGRGNATISMEYRRQSRFLCGDASFCRNFGVLDDDSNPDTDSMRSRVFRPHRTFAISSANGRIGIDFDGDGFPDSMAPPGFNVDTNNDGIVDIGQTDLGANGFGDWVVDDGRLRLFRTGVIAGEPGSANQFGGDGIASGPFDFQTIVPERDSLVANATMRYELLDDDNYVSLDFFSEAKFAYTKTTQIGQVSAFNDLLTVSLENPYIPAELRSGIDAAIAANPDLADTTTIYITRDFLDLGENRTENERLTFR
ncbi:MAG: TonB-dependent receptor plug domain-containing protein, partial [Myxococcota bacterium]